MADSAASRSSTASGNASTQRVEDGPLTLHNSDHPGMALVTAHLTGSNYLTWSIAVRTSLEAKDKLGFVDGTLPPPTDAAAFKPWKKVDSMVKSWITNSITKEISDTLIYCATSKSLWDEIEARYGVSTGPQLYQIQREMSSLQQGTDSVTSYYSKLHKTWDEMDRLVPLPTCKCAGCTCDLTGKLKEITASIRVLQFLMGLNSEFEVIRGQVLSLDPLPGVNKAFAMVMRTESQKTVTNTYSTPATEASAMLAKSSAPKWDNDNKGSGKKKGFADKKGDRFCDHCHIAGHTKDVCFKLHGYPEWFKEYKESRKGTASTKKGSPHMAGMGTTSEDLSGNDTGGKQELASMVSQLIREEMGRMMKGKQVDEQVNYANVLDYAGPEE